MIAPAFLEVLRTLYARLAGTDVNWAVTGSLCCALQGAPMPEVHDFDLQRDAAARLVGWTAAATTADAPINTSVTHLTQFSLPVIPAQAGIQRHLNWTPAFAGVTMRNVSQ